jgi:hypothetical protein
MPEKGGGRKRRGSGGCSPPAKIRRPGANSSRHLSSSAGPHSAAAAVEAFAVECLTLVCQAEQASSRAAAASTPSRVDPRVGQHAGVGPPLLSVLVSVPAGPVPVPAPVSLPSAAAAAPRQRTSWDLTPQEENICRLVRLWGNGTFGRAIVANVIRWDLSIAIRLMDREVDEAELMTLLSMSGPS